MNEGQGQNEVIMAEDDWMNWVSHGDCKKMKAGRQDKFVYINTFNSQQQFKVLYIMH